ncbi:MAG: NAD-dependent epimerase/dehydratase family protein [Dehalococcoidia bacterium]|nr:NAD-dependent epimerase/dehydratase family protein [Dehalococcoidia bacterium]
MRILLTGGAGFIGSHIAEAYLAAGHEVHIVDNLSTGRRSHAPRGATLHEVDIHARELRGVFASVRPDVVNHHAAQASVKISTGDPVLDLEVNGGGTARIAGFCVDNGVQKLIYASSGGTVYGNPGQLPVDESHPIAPTSPYGLSKYTGELYVQLFARAHGLDFTILRYGNAFGPRQDPYGEAGVVAIFTANMLAGRQCTIDGDGEQRKDYIYVGDVADANVRALESGSGGTYNIGTGQGTSVNEIFRALQDATGDATEPAFGPPRPGDVRNFWLDASRARRDLDWQATTTFEEGVRATVASLR